LEKDNVRAWYDKSVDILYMLFREGPSYEVIEAILMFILKLMRKEKLWA